MQMLTDQQMRFFETFGFVKFTGLFRDRADRISEEFERIWSANGGLHHDGRPHTGTERSSIRAFMDKSELLSSLLDDPGLKRIYDEQMIATASLQRMVHLEQSMANDGHLAEMSRKLREVDRST